MSEELTNLGLSVRKLRESIGLSQEALADKCGFDRTYISMVERGMRNISFNNLTRIARGLGVSVSTLTEDIEHGIDAD